MENIDALRLYNKVIEQRNDEINKITNYYNNILNVPDNYRWFPNLLDCGYYVGVSDRKRYKTTNLLLGGLIAYKLFGYQTAYFRTTEKECNGNLICDLYDVILQYDYLDQIFNGQYDTVKYHRNGKYFTLVNSESDTESEPILYIICVDKYLDYTSVLTLPNCNWWIYDEFITEYKPNTFMHFMSLHSTITRERFNVYIMLVGNTIDKNNKWFDELGLRTYINKMKRGSSKLIINDMGTVIRFEMFDKLSDNTKAGIIKQVLNKLFYGFDNPKMSVIRGTDKDWSVGSFSPIKNYDDDVVINNDIKLRYNLQNYSLTFVTNSVIGLHLNIKPYNDKIKSNHILIIFDAPMNTNEIYGFNKISIIKKLISERKVYFSDSYTANDFNSVLKYYNTRF